MPHSNMFLSGGGSVGNFYCAGIAWILSVGRVGWKFIRAWAIGWHAHRAGMCAGHGAGQRGGGHFLGGGAGDFFLIIQESLIFRTGGITLGMTRYSVMNLTFG